MRGGCCYARGLRFSALGQAIRFRYWKWPLVESQVSFETLNLQKSATIDGKKNEVCSPGNKRSLSDIICSRFSRSFNRVERGPKKQNRDQGGWEKMTRTRSTANEKRMCYVLLVPVWVGLRRIVAGPLRVNGGKLSNGTMGNNDAVEFYHRWREAEHTVVLLYFTVAAFQH